MSSAPVPAARAHANGDCPIPSRGHFSRVTALDEAMLSNPARIVSLAPGIIDTDMQAELRAADGAGFPEQAHFVEFKATGQLSTPQAAAARVLTYLHRADFGSDPVADVRQT